MNVADVSLAKITWEDPLTGATNELMLSEGATVGIGRLETNDICIKEQHVSRQHASIQYQDGVFVVTDLGSANGVFVNDQRLTEPYPLLAGDVIRLYVPILNFSALIEKPAAQMAAPGDTTVDAPDTMSGTRLMITGGPQEGDTIPLLLNSMTIGRATSKADWEICLHDPSISRPHARLEQLDNHWVLYDLGSANGTLVNGTPVVNEMGRVLRDGDVITMGGTVAEFHST